MMVDKSLHYSLRSFHFGNRKHKNWVVFILKCIYIPSVLLLIYFFNVFILWITMTPLGTDVLLMAPRFLSVQIFYIRVKSLQLESHGWVSWSPWNIETFRATGRQVEGSSCPKPSIRFTDIPIGVYNRKKALIKISLKWDGDIASILPSISMKS